MPKDISEELQIDLTRTASNAVSGNTSLFYDIGFNNEKFFDASSPERPYLRQTAQYRKDQNDNSAEPGEQSLTGWWLRSQSSFHFGSGINFYEPSQDDKLRFRFADSQGVNVWKQGEVSLLKNVTAGHIVVGTSPTLLRSIRWSNTDGVLMLDNQDVDKIDSSGVETHFIDHLTGTDTAVYAICDDGATAFWVTNQSSGGTKCQIFKKALTLTASDTNNSMYLDNGVVVSSAVIEYVKNRLVACINNSIYELSLSASGATNLPTPIYTDKTTTYKYTSIAESPSNIYVSGYNGIYSNISMLTTGTTITDGVPDFTGSIVVAEMPRGEIVYTIKYYVGYLLIGTSRGVRVAQVQSDGSIVYGPLLFEAEQPVYQFATSDHYAWCTTKIGGDAGLIRIDLGTQIDTLVFPYANDLQAVGVKRPCTGVAFLGNTSRLAFSAAYVADNGAVYTEDATTLRSTGYLKTGKIRFNTSENKFFKYIKERALYSGGSITVGTANADIITVDAINGNNDVGIPELDAAEYKQFVFTLRRDTTTTSVGPTLYGYQVKALPATRKQRMIQYNLWCYDNESDRNRNRVGYPGRAFDRIQTFEDIEATSDIITVQDFRTGETFQALVEECSFKAMTPPITSFTGFGGILTVTVRKI